MTNRTSVAKGLNFEEKPDTQEFLDSFLSALEEQYSYDRLRKLSENQLEKEVETINHDLDILKWRLYSDEKFWRSEKDLYEEITNLSKTYFPDTPTVDQIHQIKWAVTRIERNFDRAWRYTGEENQGFLSKIKRVSIGSKQFGGLEINLSERVVEDSRTNSPE